MYDNNNLFAKIIRGDIPSEKVYEDDKVLAFKDKFPAAPVHVLVLPKGQYKSFHDFSIAASADEVAYFFKKVRDIAESLGLTDSGYRIIANHGSDASQTIPHFHLHILGKRRLGPLVSGDVYHH